jgi:hypothetical protein
MPFQKGTVPGRLKGKGIPQKFIDQFINVYQSVKKKGGDEGSALRQAYSVLNTALRKAGYRQGKDGNWHKTSRKEELEPEVLSFPSGGIVLEENQSLAQALDSGLRYSGTALVDYAISQQGSWRERYYSPEYNDKAMIATNEYMERGYPVTVYNKHDAVFSSENPIGKIVSPLWREGDEIRYKGRISPTERGREAMILIFDEVMQPTSVRQYECKTALRRILGNEDDDNDDKGEERWILELLEGRIGGIDFCDQPGINGAGIKRLESAPEFLPTSGNYLRADIPDVDEWEANWDEETGTVTVYAHYESETEDDMDWKDITLDQLKENRPDLLASHTVAGLEALAVANTGMQARIVELEAREMPPDLSGENAKLKATLAAMQQQVADWQFQVQLEQVSHTLIGKAVAEKLREAGVGPNELAAKAKEYRDAAIMESVASVNPGDYAPQGKSLLKDEDNADLYRMAIPGMDIRDTSEMDEMQHVIHNII